MADLYVVGAGDASYNGHYVDTGTTQNGGEVYRMNPNRAILYSPSGYWEISQGPAASGSPDTGYHVFGPPDTVPANGWNVDNVAAPAPTVSTVPPPDFTLTPPTRNLTVADGGAEVTTAAAVTVTAIGAFAGNVALAVTGAPPGLTATLGSGSLGAGASTSLTLSASGVTPDTYPLLITGTSGTLTHTQTVSVTVTAPPVPVPVLTTTAQIVGNVPSILLQGS